MLLLLVLRVAALGLLRTRMPVSEEFWTVLLMAAVTALTIWSANWSDVIASVRR